MMQSNPKVMNHSHSFLSYSPHVYLFSYTPVFPLIPFLLLPFYSSSALHFPLLSFALIVLIFTHPPISFLCQSLFILPSFTLLDPVPLMVPLSYLSGINSHLCLFKNIPRKSNALQNNDCEDKWYTFWALLLSPKLLCQSYYFSLIRMNGNLKGPIYPSILSIHKVMHPFSCRLLVDTVSILLKTLQTVKNVKLSNEWNLNTTVFSITVWISKSHHIYKVISQCVWTETLRYDCSCTTLSLDYLAFIQTKFQ